MISAGKSLNERVGILFPIPIPFHPLGSKILRAWVPTVHEITIQNILVSSHSIPSVHNSNNE